MRSALSQPGVAEANLDEISVTAETVAPAATGPGPAASAGYVGGTTGVGGTLRSVDAASAGVISGAEINSRPITRPGEVLESVPGLIVTQHSGEGKANQFFLRGFNLDHGTDIAIDVDGMPVNMRTHAHGQGYADINFLIPELVGAVEYHKGPYFVRDGDFASAGSVRIDYLDTVAKNVALTSFGSFGYARALTIASAPLGQGNLLVAGEAQVYDGPWDVPDALRKLNGVVRYSQGTALDGFSVTGMAYASRWTATNQIASRAVADGIVGRFGTLNPADGGDSSRFSLSGRWSMTDDTGITRASAYVIRQQLNLFNDFTYFLNDPVAGDQFHQLDQRILGGGAASHVFQGALFGLPMENEIGVQTRTDSIRVGLFNTVNRQFRAGVLDDRVLEASGAFFYDNRVRWTDWLRTSVGFRADGYYADVVSDTAANSGKARDGVVNPKLGLVLGPWADTELYLNYGGGFHSNDVRGVTATVDPASSLFNTTRSPFLVPSTGYEVGIRNRSIAGLETAVALFRLDFASENLFQGDTGTTEPSRPSRRFGVEWTNRYAVTPWLKLEGDLTVTNARFSDVDPAGNRIPEAPTTIASAGFTFGEGLGWFGSMRLRYFGPRPLIEDDTVRSKPTALLNGRVGYNFDSGFCLSLDILNLTNAKSDQITYYYVSRLPGEGADGVADRHFHPVEPTAVRLTLAGRF
ncbi:TonB-dependent receptor plug domain-containing protein [Methylobacterium sp. WL12]|uniref:TonB-dependent receptor n=1 Tax=Methylobacterium sp. WL12 TaxID=2603890 RepID=UPI0011CA8A70|nr:TonB-dependent receptor plug domain-containing protein [Methylobacterium sp. WL12]TXM67952.1 TonB-dependent receptor plug domain-containing protein [Methylobacterium sp. WL12]